MNNRQRKLLKLKQHTYLRVQQTGVSEEHQFPLVKIQNSLRKTVGKVSPILVTLTSRSDSNFERSNINFKENKRDGVD